MGDRLVITRRGAQLGHLRPSDLVKTGLDWDDGGSAAASTEILVHRAIYQATSAQAILHTHPPHGIVLSLELDEIIPVEAEGSYLLQRVPVVSAANPVGSEESAAVVSRALSEHRVCMLRGHGLFAAGRHLEEAFQCTSSFEASARVVYLARLAGIKAKGFHGGD
jgi:L-fuculose-phosphate aldolase